MSRYCSKCWRSASEGLLACAADTSASRLVANSALDSAVDDLLPLVAVPPLEAPLPNAELNHAPACGDGLEVDDTTAADELPAAWNFFPRRPPRRGILVAPVVATTATTFFGLAVVALSVRKLHAFGRLFTSFCSCVCACVFVCVCVCVCAAIKMFASCFCEKSCFCYVVRMPVVGACRHPFHNMLREYSSTHASTAQGCACRCRCARDVYP